MAELRVTFQYQNIGVFRRFLIVRLPAKNMILVFSLYAQQLAKLTEDILLPLPVLFLDLIPLTDVFTIQTGFDRVFRAVFANSGTRCSFFAAHVNHPLFLIIILI